MSTGFLSEIASTGSEVEATLPMISFVTRGRSFLRRKMTDLAESAIGFDLPRAVPITTTENGLLMDVVSYRGGYVPHNLAWDIGIIDRQNNYSYVRQSSTTVQYRSCTTEHTTP